MIYIVFNFKILIEKKGNWYGNRKINQETDNSTFINNFWQEINTQK